MPQSAGLYFALKVTMRNVVLHRAVFSLRFFYPNRAVADREEAGVQGAAGPLAEREVSSQNSPLFPRPPQVAPERYLKGYKKRIITILMFRLLATDRRSRSRRKGQGMTRISWPSCPFAVRFGHRFGFSDHLKARGPRPRRPFPPAWRFSARFGHTRRCAKLLQNRWHDTTYLSRGDDVTTPFPRPEASTSWFMAVATTMLQRSNCSAVRTCTFVHSKSCLRKR